MGRLFENERDRRNGATSENQNVGIGYKVWKDEKCNTGKKRNNRFLFFAVNEKP